jgi:ferredoxin
MRIAVDRTKCAGMGICEGLDPERFQIQQDGKAEVLDADLDGDEAIDIAQEAVDMCPTASLRIVG